MAPAAPIITSPEAGSVLTSSSVTVSGTCEDTVTSVIVWDASTILTTVGASDGTFTASISLADGEHALWVTGSDGSETSADGDDVSVMVSSQPEPSSDPAGDTPAPGDGQTPAPGASEDATVVDTPTDQVAVTPVAETDPPSPVGEDGVPVLQPDPAVSPSQPDVDPTSVPAASVDPTQTAAPSSVGGGLLGTAPAGGAPTDDAAAQAASAGPTDPSVTDPASALQPSSAVSPPTDDDSVAGKSAKVDASDEVVPDAQAPAGGTKIDPAQSLADQTAIPAGDTASTSAPVTPDAPVIEEPAANEDLVDSLVVISGTAEPSGATVTVYADSAKLGIASVDDKGDWRMEATLPNGQYVLAAVTSESNLVSGKSDPVEITVNYDSHAEPAPLPDDPDQAFALYIRERLLRGYPLSWSFIQELRATAELWLDAKGL